MKCDYFSDTKYTLAQEWKQWRTVFNKTVNKENNRINRKNNDFHEQEHMKGTTLCKDGVFITL